jgi:hypothetical protein
MVLSMAHPVLSSLAKYQVARHGVTLRKTYPEPGHHSPVCLSALLGIGISHFRARHELKRIFFTPIDMIQGNFSVRFYIEAEFPN